MDPPRQELIDLLCRCTVRLSVEGESGHGTGFFVAPGLVLTCSHVVEAAQARTVPVHLHWGGQLYSAEIVTFLPKPYPDLSLLRLDLEGHPCVLLGQDINLRDPLYSYGYTDEYSTGDSATFEYEGPTDERQPLLKLKEGQVRPGLSGAPLLNQRTGMVCGIVKRTRDRDTDLGGRAVPASVILSLLGELGSLQQGFHLRDSVWLECLSPEQRQRLRWRVELGENPFYGKSGQLLGRDHEIQRIMARLRAGGHCSIVGSQGSGKSRLVQEVRALSLKEFHWPAEAILRIGMRTVGNLGELQRALTEHLGVTRAGEIRKGLRSRPLRLLILDDLGGMPHGARGLEMRRWLKGQAEDNGIRLLITSNDILDRLFPDNPAQDSPLAGLDRAPVGLPPLPIDACCEIVRQRLAGGPLDISQFADLLARPQQPGDLLHACAALYEKLRETWR